MFRFWLGRLALAVLVMWLVSVLVFWGSQILPGDVAQLALGQYATPEAVATLREQLGLNQPAVTRYFLWLAGMLHGDWGVSLVTGTPVAQMLSERAANTGLLAIATVVIAVPLAIGLGMLMSLGAGRWGDRLGSIAVLSLAAAPEFLIATVGVLILAVKLRWLPAISYLTPDSSLGHVARALVLPVMTLVIVISAQMAHVVGDTLGLLAAVRMGWVDMVLCRIVDVLLSLPKIIVGMVAVAALGASIPVLVLVTGLVYAASVFRIARALGMDLIRQDFVTAARARGEGTLWILFGEIVPHVVYPLAADFALRLGFAILFMSSLSFLGLGVQPPMVDWGGMVRENLEGLAVGSYASLYAALAIAVVSVILNLLVDATHEKTAFAELRK